MNFEYNIHERLNCPYVIVHYPDIITEEDIKKIKSSLLFKCNVYKESSKTLSIWLSAPGFYTSTSEICKLNTVYIDLETFKNMIQVSYALN